MKTATKAKTSLYQKKISNINNVMPQRQYVIDTVKRKIFNSIENSRIAYIFVRNNMDTKITTFIQNIYPLPNDILEEVMFHFQHLEYPKNYFLLKPGKSCKHIWFMTQGAVRYFYTNEQGKEMNTWFSLDEQIITDAPSLVNQSASQESIQLMEDSEMYAIEYTALQALLQKHHSFALWYIKLVEVHYVSQIEDRIADLQFLDAKQRYQKLLNLYPDITNRISLGNIASYLNITQETLSRIRAGKL